METAYVWQEQCLNRWDECARRGIVQAVTGAGKTMLALQAVERLRMDTKGALRVLVVVPTKALMQQWKRLFLERSLQWESAADIRYEICVINSARYRLAREILRELREGASVFLIADECHRYTGCENRKIFEFVPYLTECPGAYCALGLSATVQGMETIGVLEPALGRIIYRYSYERALREGVIAEFVLFQIALDFEPDENEEYVNYSEEMRLVKSRLCGRYPSIGEPGAPFFAILQDLAKGGGNAGSPRDEEGSRLAASYLYLAYQRKKLVCMAKARIACALCLIRELDIRKKIMIFGESIEQADVLYYELKEEYGDRVGRYHSKAGEQANRNALYRFRSGEILILITCRALDEGIDVPDAGVGIVLSGTGVERQRIQRLGRILRKSEEKTLARLYYLFVKESREEKGYFPKASEYFRVEELEYDASGDCICSRSRDPSG